MIAQDRAESNKEPINYEVLLTNYHKVNAATRKDKYKNM